jgi:hypothetical protein
MEIEENISLSLRFLYFGLLNEAACIKVFAISGM